MKHASHPISKTGDITGRSLGILLYARQHSWHRTTLFLVDLEQIISYSVLWLSPKHCIAFNVHLQLEFRVLSCCDILCDILQDYKIDKLANELSVMHILASILLGVVQDLVIDDTCPHVEGWLQDLHVTRNTYNLIQ